MYFRYIHYIWPLIISAVFTLSLGIFVLFKRRNSKGFTNFIISMLVVTIWCVGNTLEMSGIELETKLFWANIQYIAYCYSPVTLLSLCMEFTGYDKWLRSKKILWAAVVPTIVLILVWTDRYHGLIRYNMHLVYTGIFSVIAKEYGPVFYVHAIYSHFLNLLAVILLIREALFRKTIYRKQVIALLIGISLIVLPNILYITGLSPIKEFDITPIFFGPAGLIIYLGIFNYRMFDLVPLARTTVIETMTVGMMVLDLQNRVLDINSALEKIDGLPATEILGMSVEVACKNIPELVKACMDDTVTHTEFTIQTNALPKVYEVWLSPLTNKQGIQLGRLVVIYEITEIKRAQQIFIEQQWTNAVNKERERLARDLHDNLGQILGFINLQTQGIRQELSGVKADQVDGILRELNKLIDVSQSAHTELREYINNIRSTSYMGKDYALAISKKLSAFEEQSNVKVKLKVIGDLNDEILNWNIRLNVINILNEALNNVRKHAEAETVTVTFIHTPEKLSVSIEDNGKGFELSKELNTKVTFGLDIMRERASEIGGSIIIKSTVGKGSRIELKVPLKEEKEKSAKEINAG